MLKLLLDMIAPPQQPAAVNQGDMYGLTPVYLASAKYVRGPNPKPEALNPKP